GWYLGRALGAFPEATGIALDISTAAAKQAARVPRVAAIVADVWRPLPLLPASVEAVLCVFAPRNGAEFRRVLAASGRLVVVTPNPGHLATVRGRYGLLDIDPTKDERLAATLTGFVETTQVRVTSHTEAGADLVRDVIGMGPNAFHAQVVAAPSLLEVDVTVRTFRAEPSA
ncbi:MAG: SAM-dependent methyltransferase, partial [Propionibacteriaceae bacterium]